ncbi:porin [Pseudoduganella violacea]|uniref:Putative porin n=1 Tax=Pseudoduganella violacea TaxID=1715466 RepID=A0A7W5BFV0_9BURK|nr:putative porin [Pseudoduganella violacea]
MKKLTLAALLIGGFAASAQAQSNVTVYGVVDLGIAKTTGQSAVERENHASRLGFRGTEDLGGGLSAIFNLESEILADTGAQKGNLFDRQAWVGLKGSFGQVYLGRTKDIIDGALPRIEPFNADGVIGKVNEPMMRNGVGQSRVANAITYNSPSYQGLAFALQAVLSEVKGADAGYSALATYDNGPISLHAGYQRAVQTAVSAVKPTLWTIGAGYKFGDTKVSGGYSKGKTDVATTGDYKSWLLGVSHSIGGGDLKAVYGKQEQNNNKVSGLNTVKEMGVGYDYHLSKRTDLYAYAGKEKVKALTSYQLGISHKF